jgi:4-hydroxymandelate oxidase
VASHGAFHAGAEIETQFGAAAANATLIVSTHGSLSIKEFSTGIKQPWWFQLYIHRDRSISKKLILEAQTCGAEAIILTIDTPVAGYRDQDRKSFVGSSQRLTPGQPDSTATQESS